MASKIALITGASSGIGQACAHAFAAAGYDLIIAARRKSRIDELGRLLEEQHAIKVVKIELDVRDQSAVESSIAALTTPWKKIDVLVNNAGLSRGLVAFNDGLISDWDEMLDTNVKGLLYVSRAVTPLMVKRQSGHVINVGSIAGHEVYPNGAVYCASKHAVDAITTGMRMDLCKHRVKVSTVDPGLVNTEFSNVRFHGDQQRADSTYNGMTPLSAVDVAETVLWMASTPQHVNIAEVLLLPTDQAAATVVRRDS
ncbi:MAG: 3-hydroxy acid dehydrogenase/malonic semialdehyde reductase [Myxococcota bacterium]|jgi:3-hydroxy acid dehydrogenase/malonic semialdehyde reductase